MSLTTSAVDAGNRLGHSAEYGVRRIRKPAFYLLTVAFLAFLVFALRETMAMVVNAWTAGYVFPDHRVHHLMIGGTLTVFAATVAIQLYRPTKRVGAHQAALAFVAAAFVLTLVASGVAAVGEILIFVIPVLAIALLHPARQHLRPHLAQLDRRLLALAGVGAIGFWTVAAGEYASHTTLTNEHVVFGHYEFVLIAMVTIGLFALLAAFRPVGWRALAYAAAALAVLFAAASFAFPGPEQGSSLGTVAAIAVVIWAVAFVALAEYVSWSDPAGSEPDDSQPSEETA